MANWISVNCIDPSDIRVSEDKKEELSLGVIFTAIDESENIACFEAQETTEQVGVITPIEINMNCLECLSSNNFKLIFRNCLDKSDYYVSPSSFLIELPSVGSVCRATISELDGCYTFIGVTSDNVRVSQAIFDTAFEDCSDCLFDYNKELIINNQGYQDFKQNNVKDNYNSIIQNRINPQSKEPV